jgi:hypothetical protein
MSWTNFGPVTDLAPGQSAFWWYVFNGNQDVGVQVAGPNILPDQVNPGTLGTLVASNQGKTVLGLVDPQHAQVQYVVTITNTDPTESAVHNLQGGGVS